MFWAALFRGPRESPLWTTRGAGTVCCGGDGPRRPIASAASEAATAAVETPTAGHLQPWRAGIVIGWPSGSRPAERTTMVCHSTSSANRRQSRHIAMCAPSRTCSNFDSSSSSLREIQARDRSQARGLIIYWDARKRLELESQTLEQVVRRVGQHAEDDQPEAEHDEQDGEADSLSSLLRGRPA